MAKAKTPKRKVKREVSRNHFVSGHTDSVLLRGSLKGVRVDDETIRYGDEDIGKLKLVGDSQKTYGDKREKVEGETVYVTVTPKAVLFTPACGDTGYGITKDTFVALASAVIAAYKDNVVGGDNDSK